MIAVAAAAPWTRSAMSSSIGSARSRSGVAEPGRRAPRAGRATAPPPRPGTGARPPGSGGGSARSPARREDNRLRGKLCRRRVASPARARPPQPRPGLRQPRIRPGPRGQRGEMGAALRVGCRVREPPVKPRPAAGRQRAHCGRRDQRMRHREPVRCLDEYAGQHRRVHRRSRIVQVAEQGQRLGQPIRPAAATTARASPASALSERDSRSGSVARAAARSWHRSRG